MNTVKVSGLKNPLLQIGDKQKRIGCYLNCIVQFFQNQTLIKDFQVCLEKHVNCNGKVNQQKYFPGRESKIVDCYFCIIKPLLQMIVTLSQKESHEEKNNLFEELNVSDYILKGGLEKFKTAFSLKDLQIYGQNDPSDILLRILEIINAELKLHHQKSCTQFLQEDIISCKHKQCSYQNVVQQNKFMITRVAVPKTKDLVKKTVAHLDDWKCEQCSCNEAKKTSKPIITTPKILIMQLQFQEWDPFQNCGKSVKKIFKLNKRLHIQGKDYEFKNSINKRGIYGFCGHYVNYRKVKETLYLIDDEDVKKSIEKKVYKSWDYANAATEAIPCFLMYELIDEQADSKLEETLDLTKIAETTTNDNSTSKKKTYTGRGRKKKRRMHLVRKDSRRKRQRKTPIEEKNQAMQIDSSSDGYVDKTIPPNDEDPWSNPLMQQSLTKMNKELKKVHMHFCENCHERRPHVRRTNSTLCSKCKQKNSTYKMKFCKENDMIPEHYSIHGLPDLTPIETMLMSQCFTQMSVVRLSGGGQYALKGNCIAFNQKIKKFYNTLPHKVKNLPMIRIQNPNSEQNDQKEYFEVRRKVIETWLNFLKENNRCYQNITISYENLNALPEHGVPEDIPTIITSSLDDVKTKEIGPTTEQQQPNPSTPKSKQPNQLNPPTRRHNRRRIQSKTQLNLQPKTSEQIDCLIDDEFDVPVLFASDQSEGSTESEFSPTKLFANEESELNEIQYDYVPSLEDSGLEADKLKQILNAIKQCENVPISDENQVPNSEGIMLPFPERDVDPVNEYKEIGLFTKAFPHLFPTAKGDITIKGRNTAVKRKKWLHHLMFYSHKVQDEWIYPFVKDERFLFYAHNLHEREQINDVSGVWINKNLKNSKTFDDVEEMESEETTEKEMKKLFHKMSTYATKITGSNSYWHSIRNELTAIFTQLSPSCFVTASFADYHNCFLHKLLNTIDKSTKERVHAIINNPHLASWFFDHQQKLLWKHVLQPVYNILWRFTRYEWQSRGSGHTHSSIGLPDYQGLQWGTDAILGHLAKCRSYDPNHLLVNDLVVIPEQGHGTFSIKKIKIPVTLQKDAVPKGLTTKIIYQQNINEVMYDVVNIADKTNKCTVKFQQMTPLKKFTEVELKDYIQKGENAEKNMIKMADRFISCMNYVKHSERNVSRPKGHPHPCSVNCYALNSPEMKRFYAELTNCVQKHVCSDYCLRLDKVLGELYCRGGFPRPIIPQSKIIYERRSDGTYKIKINFKTNDSQINNNNKLHILGSISNTDWQMIIDWHAVVSYLAKYQAKPEKSSKAVIETMCALMQKVRGTEQLGPKKFIRKCFMLMCSGRSFSKQEVCHYLQGLPYVQRSGLTVVKCNLGGYGYQQSKSTGKITKFIPIWKKYEQRVENHLAYPSPQGHPETDLERKQRLTLMSLHEFLVTYKLSKKSRKTMQYDVHDANKTVVINWTGKNYSNDPSKDDYVEFCRQSLVKFKAWNGNIENAWNKCTQDSDVINLWENYYKSTEGILKIPAYVKQAKSRMMAKIILSQMPEDDEELAIQDSLEDWQIAARLGNADLQEFKEPETETNPQGWSADCDYLKKKFGANVFKDFDNWINKQRTQYSVGKNYKETNPTLLKDDQKTSL